MALFGHAIRPTCRRDKRAPADIVATPSSKHGVQGARASGDRQLTPEKKLLGPRRCAANPPALARPADWRSLYQGA
jgi:hypothetical protein